VKHLGIIILHHVHTRTPGRNYVPVVLKFTNQFLANLFAMVTITFMKSRKATAGLVGIIIHTTTNMLQNFHHVKGGLGVELVDVTGDEYIYYHEGSNGMYEFMVSEQNESSNANL